METQRTKNAIRNATTGFFLRFYQMLGPFILRTVMIYTLGMNYLGLNGLFTSILQVLNLAELGVGSAMIYSMYKPIIEKNDQEISALMNLYKKYYRTIGFIILLMGLLITPFIPNLINGEVPSDVNIYILYFMNLFATVLSYWLFAYKSSLLNANQRLDVINKITIVNITFQYVLQVIVLVLFHNYYFYVVISLLSQVFLNITTSIITDKMYPKYKAKGTLDKVSIQKINRRVRDLFTSKIGEVVVNSADTIVISAFLGLNLLAIYNNYYYIIVSLLALFSILFNSAMAGIGNSLIVESKEKNFNDLKNFTFLISWFGCFGACSLLCLFQPFMELWVGIENILPFDCVICFVIYFYLRVINQTLIVYKDAAGLWHKDRFRPLITAILNLGLNLILVHFIGIYGIILSTVISMGLMGFPWLLKNVFTLVFQTKMKEYIKILIRYCIIVIVCCLVTFAVCNFYQGNKIMTLIIRAIICLLIPNIIYILVSHRKKEFKYVIGLLDNMLGTKFKPLHQVFSKITK